MLPDYLTKSRSCLESSSRRRCQSIYLGDATALCRVLGKYKMYVSTQDIGITPHLCLEGHWEAWVTLALARMLQAGWYCVDVGANHGYYTLIMADAVGQAGRVLAVEPNPALANLLRRNVDVNGFTGYTAVIEKAVSDVCGATVSLVVEASKSINGSLFREATESDTVFDVNTTTVDVLTQDWSQVDLIKLDAEGAEESIWQGMASTLEKHSKIIVIMEFNALKYPQPQVFLSNLKKQGFPLRYIDYNSAITEVSESQLIENPAGTDWMLYLQRE